MEGFTAGMTFAEECHKLRAEIARVTQLLVEHDLSEGSHASAFSAHGASPGVVEEAEDTAAEIVEQALEILETATETALDTIEEAGEGAAEVADTAVEAVTEPAAEVATTASEPAQAVAEEAKPERSPHRPHALHRPIRLFGRG